MISQVDPNRYTVPLATPESAGWNEAVEGCHPSLKGIAVAGLSAVVAATRGEQLHMPLLSEEGAAINPGFIQAFVSSLEPGHYELAERGIRIIATAKAASALLAVAELPKYMYTGPLNHHFTKYQAKQRITNAVRQIQLGELAGTPGVTSLQVRTLGEDGNDMVSQLSLAYGTGLDSSVSANIHSFVNEGDVTLTMSAGSREGDFIHVDNTLALPYLARFTNMTAAALSGRYE